VEEPFRTRRQIQKARRQARASARSALFQPTESLQPAARQQQRNMEICRRSNATRGAYGAAGAGEEEQISRRNECYERHREGGG